MSKQLKVGDFAPDFTLRNQHGDLVKLSDFRHKSNVILYFYPKDHTAGCTAEACGFRDHYDEFITAGAEVIGISSDDNSSHFKFASKFRLPFTLLSDSGSKVRRLYNIPNNYFFIPGRVTFVIDKKGVIQYRFDFKGDAMRHVEEAVKVLKFNV